MLVLSVYLQSGIMMFEDVDAQEEDDGQRYACIVDTSSSQKLGKLLIGLKVFQHLFHVAKFEVLMENKAKFLG